MNPALSPALTEAPNYEVTNSRGIVVRTFGDASMARKWARRNANMLGPLVIDSVTVTVTRKRVTTYRPRTDLKVVGS